MARKVSAVLVRQAPDRSRARFVYQSKDIRILPSGPYAIETIRTEQELFNGKGLGTMY